ncbi:hypothetical protein ACKWTF_014449 [Chironomus riparius]
MWMRKFKLLMWKNWILIKRHPISATIELLFSILVIVIFTIVKNEVPKEEVPTFLSQELKLSQSPCIYGSKHISAFGYAPSNEFNDRLMNSVSKNFEKKFVGFKDEDELSNWIKKQAELVAGVIFETSASSPPNHLQYTIRMPNDISIDRKWHTDKIYHHQATKEPRYEDLKDPKAALYYSTCFVKLQNEIDHAFIQELGKGQEIEKLERLKTFPILRVMLDRFEAVAVYILPMLMVFCVIYSKEVLIKVWIVDFTQ